MNGIFESLLQSTLNSNGELILGGPPYGEPYSYKWTPFTNMCLPHNGEVTEDAMIAIKNFNVKIKLDEIN